jgi:polyferredoxin
MTEIGHLQLPKTLAPKTGWVKAVMVSLPMLLITALLLLHGKQLSNPVQLIPAIITYLFANILFYLMIFTGKTNKYRSIFFVTASFLFIISFIANIVEIRETMALPAKNMLNGETPLCPLVIPMLIVPAALTDSIIFPGSLFASFAGVASMLIIWIGFSLAIGRGWCSWICFFGGMDEGFSKLCDKSKITIDNKWTNLPIAILIAIILLSAITFSPTYCEWLCPFKTVTEYPAITSFKTVVQAIIFVSLFAGLVIILPILTGRRTQCGLFCLFGPFQALTNKFNIFNIRINRTQCINCKICLKTCPTFSINENSRAQGKPLFNCTKCGKCIDTCPKRAISYHIKGTPLGVNGEIARILFLYPAFIFAATIGGGCIYGGLERIFRLLVTGSMI